jgi:hypothetical protein
LRHVKSRAAEVGDKLITARFSGSDTGGFAEVGDPSTAVCLRPGTEVVFEHDVEFTRPYARLLPWPRLAKAGHNMARFRQVNMDKAYLHHDALEFPNGLIVMVTRLRPGQHATVIQLPADRQHATPTTVTDNQRLTAWAR